MSKLTPDNEFAKRLANAASNWTPPGDWIEIQTIDAHTEGEPLRVIVAGYPQLSGGHVLERRRLATAKFDEYRRALMWEPRGHADMYGCLIVPPDETADDPADFGVLFLHNEGYSSMCGHGIIAVTRVAIEIGLVAITSPITHVRIDAPAGRINAFASVLENRVVNVSFENVPSYVVGLDQSIEIAGLGAVKYDLAFGGAYYAYVDASQFDISLEPRSVNRLITIGRQIKNSIMNSVEIQHPIHDDLSFLYGTIFIGPATAGNHSRNVCIFAEGEVDRSPTGTGVSGRAAIHFARGEIQLGEEIKIESILGTTFDVAAVKPVTIGPHSGIVPRVTGTAFITGRHRFIIDPDDPLEDGFIFR